MRTCRLFPALFAFVIALPLASTRVFAQAEKQAQLEYAERQRKLAEERRLENRAKEAATVIKTNPKSSSKARMNTVMPQGVPAIIPNTIYVTGNRLLFMYTEPSVTVPLPKAERRGHYVWRWNVADIAEPFSIVLAADTAMRTANMGDILKASRVRVCRSIYESVAARCTEPVDAFVSRQGPGFRIEVSDSILFNAVRKAHPTTALGVTYSPLGRTVKSLVKFVYQDQHASNARQ